MKAIKAEDTRSLEPFRDRISLDKQWAFYREADASRP